MSGAFDEDAFDVGAFDEGTTTPYVIIPTAPLRGRAALAHMAPFFSGRPFTPAQALQPPRHFFPEPVTVRGRPARAHTYQFFATSPGIKVTIFAGFGPDGAATFILSLQPGTKLTFGWSTDIFRSYSGLEQRVSPFGQPRRRFDGMAFLVESSSRDARGALMRSAASGATFLLAVPMEEISLSADSSAQTVFVTTTALSDWAIAKQRVVVVAPNGSSVVGVIQIVTSTTIKLDVTPGAVGKKGGRIMPLVPVLLDAAQAFSRYPVTVDVWSIKALANAFGWVGTDAMGIGALVTTFNAGEPIPASTITDFDLLIWDRTNAIDGQASESMMSGAEVLDAGALPSGAGSALAPDWARSIKFRSNRRDDWQWFKAFLRLCRGRQRAFGLSTNRPDIVVISAAGSGMTIQSSTATGGGDYVSWFASTSHRRLALTSTTGAIQYVEVVSVTDNLNGTLSLSLDISVIGTVAKASFLELVRFERDEIESTWSGGVFAIDEVCRAVQDFFETPSRDFFDAEAFAHFQYSGIGADLPPTTQTLFVQLGKVSIVHWTSDRSLSFGGIRATGGNVDGMVVCLSVVNNNSFALILQHEEATFAAPQDRMLNSGLSSVTGISRATWYRYRQAADGGVGRWIQIM